MPALCSFSFQSLTIKGSILPKSSNQWFWCKCSKYHREGLVPLKFNHLVVCMVSAIFFSIKSLLLIIWEISKSYTMWFIIMAFLTWSKYADYFVCFISPRSNIGKHAAWTSVIYSPNVFLIYISYVVYTQQKIQVFTCT